MDGLYCEDGNKSYGNVASGGLGLDATWNFRLFDAFDQFFPKGDGKLVGPSLPIFHLEKPGILAGN